MEEESQEEQTVLPTVQPVRKPEIEFEELPAEAPPKPSFFRKSKFQDAALPSVISLRPVTAKKSGFVFSKPKPTQTVSKPKSQATLDEETDPLDAFMKTIENDVVAQEQFKEDEEENQIMNVITADDVMVDTGDGDGFDRD